MKRILFLFLSLCSLVLSAQDIIIKKDGTEVKCKLLEVGTEEVRYKRWTNQNGPTVIEDKADVFMIKYQNGEKDVFEKNIYPSASQSIRNNNSPVVANLAFNRLSESGLAVDGNYLSMSQAEEVMGNRWTDFNDSFAKRKKGNAFIIVSSVLRTTGFALITAGGASGEYPLFIVGGGLRVTAIPFTALGVVNLAKGQRSCKKIVKEYCLGVNNNGLAFSVKF